MIGDVRGFNEEWKTEVMHLFIVTLKHYGYSFQYSDNCWF